MSKYKQHEQREYKRASEEYNRWLGNFNKPNKEPLPETKSGMGIFGWIVILILVVGYFSQK